MKDDKSHGKSSLDLQNLGDQETLFQGAFKDYRKREIIREFLQQEGML